MSSSRTLSLCLLLVLLAAAGLSELGGQTFAPQFDAEDPGGVFTPRDRRLQGLLEQAQQELSTADGDHQEALGTLQRIIDEAEDVFTDSTMKVSLREEAARIIAASSEQTRKQYEGTFGAEAASLLKSADADGREARLGVIRRFFHTTAGAEAAFRVAATEMDSGHFLTAARLLDRLRTEHRGAGRFEPDLSLRCVLCYWRSGETKRAAVVLEEAALALNGLQLAGVAVPQLPTTDTAVQWLSEHLGEPPAGSDVDAREWRMPHGSPSRSASVAAVSVLFDDAWSVPLIRDRDVDEPSQVEELHQTLQTLEASAREAGWMTIPALTPLVVGDLVVFPSYGTVKAVDVEDGSLRWAALPADHTFVDALTNATGSRRQQLASDMNDFLAQRAWRDATSSQISSDGKRVYCVRDSGMVGGLPPQFAERAQMNHPRLPRAFNALRAYDAVGGNWIWEAGGARTRTPLPLAGTFFLGAPLAVDGTLYVMGEDLGQVRLHALVPETGEVLWSTPLVNGDVDIEDDLDRRLAGLSPTLAGGLLICPTGGGLVVAVDPLTRTLKWGLRYRDPQSETSPQRFGRGPFIGFPQTRAQQTTLAELMAEPHWHDCSVVAAGSTLLVAPPDVSEYDDERRLLCLNLLDGTSPPPWQRARGDSLYIGGVYENTVLLIGERQVEGVDFQNGHTLWTIPIDRPSGRGVRSGRLYHVPLQGAIATIDVSAGKLLAVSPVASGKPLGNLIAVNGRLISQSAMEIRSFRPRKDVEQQIARDLEANPDDAVALASRGELRLHSGDTVAGLADLRRAVAESDLERPRTLLVTTLLEGLRSDFAGYRQHVEEIDRLANGPALRSEFLMTYAQGLLEGDETTAAFEQYVRLLTEGDGGATMDHTDDGRQVRRDRRVQGRLAQLYGGAQPDQQAELDAVIDRHLAGSDASRKSQLTRSLAAAIPRLRHQDLSESAIEEDAGAVSATRLEARLLSERRHSSAEEQASIAARLVQLYARHGRVESVIQLLDELETIWAESPCLDGQTGAEWAAAIRHTDDMTKLLAGAVHWPTGHVEVNEDIGSTGPFVPLRVEGPTDPLATFGFLPDNQGRIAVQDGYGRPIPEGMLTMLPAGASSFQSQYMMQRGHRAVLFQGTQFKLLDLMDGTPRVVLEELLVDVTPADSIGLRMSQRHVRRQLGFRGMVLWSDDPNENGSVGPLNDSIFCFLRGNTLHARDPFTGEPFWSMAGVTHGSEIFADADYVVLVPIGQNNAEVYRALDGEKLDARRTLPADVVRDRRGADWGRYFLRQIGEGGDAKLAMYDPVTEENVWERPMPVRYHWTPRDGADLVLVDQEGKLTVLDWETGNVLQEAEVAVPEGMMSISVLNLPDQWVLFTYRRPAADADAQIFQAQITQATFAVNGPATAFNRSTGEVAWSRDVSTQMVMPGLPARWPLLSLSAIVQATPRVEGQRVIPVLTRRIELLDRRTGQTVHEAETDGSSRQLDSFWRISNSPPQLRIRYGLLELVVSFSDEAPAPEVEADPSKDEQEEPS